MSARWTETEVMAPCPLSSRDVLKSEFRPPRTKQWKWQRRILQPLSLCFDPCSQLSLLHCHCCLGRCWTTYPNGIANLHVHGWKLHSARGPGEPAHLVWVQSDLARCSSKAAARFNPYWSVKRNQEEWRGATQRSTEKVLSFGSGC